jgi:CheY-like chemotaxis protein
MGHVDTETTCFQIPDGATLLVVDDDPSLRRSLRRMLDPNRIFLVEAADGERAIRLIERDEAELFDLVLTDLQSRSYPAPN